MSVRVVTARQLNGPAWADKYPLKANDLWLFAIVGGRKKKKRVGPPTDENKQLAERKRRQWEIHIERAELGEAQIIAPAFETAVQDFARHGMTQHAWKTRAGREYQLGVLEKDWGEIAVDAIDAEMVAKWGEKAMEGGKSIRTVNGYLDALSKLYQYAVRSTPGLENPVPAARKLLTRDIELTASYRAMNDDNCNPLTAGEMRELLKALDAKGNANTTMTVLLCHDAGLRHAEALGLRWGNVWWGADENDTTRHMTIQESRSGNRKGNTKSGRSRMVAMSRRVRARLMALYMERGRPADDEYVITQSWQKNIRERIERARKVARIRPLKVKDLRDTYASTLVTHGIVTRWISLQLGHASLATTERHYAKYMLSDGYQNPWNVPEGCLPTDLFVELESAAPAILPYTPASNERG